MAQSTVGIVRKNTPEPSKEIKPTMEQVVEGFHRLRQEQTLLMEKIAECEADLNEHVMVENMLKKLESDRKCFRRVGGALVEKTVKDVTPDITNQKTQITDALSSMRAQLEAKTRDLSEYKKTYNIVIRGVDVPIEALPTASPSGS